MRRRFGRRRRGGDEAKRLDVARELSRVVETAEVPVSALEAVAEEEVPSTLAAVGVGTDSDGSRCVVSVSPDSGAAAWLGALAVGLRLAHTESFTGKVWALSPNWRSAGRALLQSVVSPPFELIALATRAERVQDGAGTLVQAEVGPSIALSTEIAGGLPRASGDRAGDALQGLAAKHGGVLQRDGAQLRLVLLGQSVALVGPDELEILRPRRDRVALRPETFSEAFDQLEGSLRKFLGDRKNRDGEPGLRARHREAFREYLGLRQAWPWPVGWGDECPLDALAVDDASRGVGMAIRESCTLASLLPIFEAASYLAPVMAWLVPSVRRETAGLPVSLAVAAGEVSPAAQRVLEALSPAGAAHTLEAGRGEAKFTSLGQLSGPSELSGTAATPAARPVAPAPERSSLDTDASTRPSEDADGDRAESSREGEEGAADDPAKPARRFEEMSLFDLSDEDDGAGEGGARRRRRRGGRGRGRGGAEGRSRGESVEGGARAETAGESSEPAPEPEEDGGRPRRGRRRRRRRRSRPLMVEDVAEEEVDDEEESTPADESEEEETSLDSGEDEGSDEDEDVDALQEDATSAALEETPSPARPDRPARPVRRRAAIVAHADPVSIGAAVLLARDLRMVEGIWIYEQEDLMTFFRSVATDLGDGVSIQVIGFTASPARETLQTASLYSDRLTWFDHHEWPPEDIDAMRNAIGDDDVHIVPGTGSSLPLVAAVCTRRSRFSDKFLDLLTGRFTPHDYERWGRLWWWRLKEFANQSGERRRDLEPLLSGRPSDLAKEASKHELPPLPPEAEFVAGRDIPLVHFGGYTLLRLLVPAELELTLTARIARERYGAQLVVAAHEGDRAVVLMGDESNNRRSFDLNAMAEHLATKFAWVEPLPSADHVTRIRVTDLLQRPDRMDEIVAEMAMGRSVLER